MATEPTSHRMRQTGGAPLGGTRSQAMQRLQIGLSGLAAMILLVALANIIMDRAKESEELSVPEAAPTMAPGDAPTKAARDPLADVGVVPDLPASPVPTAAVPQGTGDVPTL